MAWAKNGTPDTLSGTSDTVTISDLTSTIFNVSLFHTFPSGIARNQIGARYGNGSIDGGNNYATRRSDNGATDALNTSFDAGIVENQTESDKFCIFYTINISAEEKLSISQYVDAGATGAGNAPNRTEAVWKWVNTSAQFDQAQIFNLNAANSEFATDTQFSMLGTD